MAKTLMAVAAGLALLASTGAKAGYSKQDCADKAPDKYDAHQCTGTPLSKAYVSQMQTICGVEAGFVVGGKDAKTTAGMKKLHLENLYKTQWEIVHVCEAMKKGQIAKK